MPELSAHYVFVYMPPAHPLRRVQPRFACADPSLQAGAHHGLRPLMPPAQAHHPTAIHPWFVRNELTSSVARAASTSSPSRICRPSKLTSVAYQSLNLRAELSSSPTPPPHACIHTPFRRPHLPGFSSARSFCVVTTIMRCTCLMMAAARRLGRRQVRGTAAHTGTLTYTPP